MRGAIDKASSRAAWRTPFRCLWNVSAAVGLLMCVVTATPLVGLWAGAYAGPWADPQGDVLILLAADAIDPPSIGQNSYWRSVYAAWAWKEGWVREIIIAGGPASPYVEPTSELMKTFLVASGVPSAVIRTEVTSRSTRENALAVKDMIGITDGRAVLMTSDYHMLRARRAFEHVGLAVQPRPIPDAIKRASRPRHRWGTFLDLVNETIALIAYRLKGWI